MVYYSVRIRAEEWQSLVECGGLENRCGATHRGFESYLLRHRYQFEKPYGFSWAYGRTIRIRCDELAYELN